MVLSNSEVAFIEKQLLTIMKVNKGAIGHMSEMSFKLAQVAYDEIQLFRKEAGLTRSEGKTEEDRGED